MQETLSALGILSVKNTSTFKPVFCLSETGAGEGITLGSDNPKLVVNLNPVIQN